jgi:hypothetical protein
MILKYFNTPVEFSDATNILLLTFKPLVMSREENLIKVKETAEFIFKELLFNPKKATENDVKEVTRQANYMIKLLFENECSQDVNWLLGWPNFDFTGLNQTEIMQNKQQFEAYIRTYMCQQGLTNKITFVWAETSTGVYTVSGFLCPPAVVLRGGPGGGTMDPQQPPKP